MLLTNRTVSHFSYSVVSIERAVHYWSSALGAGPFFVLEHMNFDWAEHRGKPCTFDHSAAFGQWGPIAIELQQVHAGTAPATLTELLIPSPSPVINHVAYITPTPEEDSAQLSAGGCALPAPLAAGMVGIRFAPGNKPGVAASPMLICGRSHPTRCIGSAAGPRIKIFLKNDPGQQGVLLVEYAGLKARTNHDLPRRSQVVAAPLVATMRSVSTNVAVRGRQR